MVHFPPWPAEVPAPQASLAALTVSTLGESAGFFRENGSLSLVVVWGTGSTDLSGGTCHFHLRGKCREFLRKWFTFPCGCLGYRLHRPLSPHSAFPPPGESAGNFRENGSLSPAAGRGAGFTGLSRRTCHFHPRGKCREFPRFWCTFPRAVMKIQQREKTSRPRL